MNPPGVFKIGVRQKPWSTKDIPSTSGKLLQEFDKRRSIKDMFKKPSLSHASSSSQSIAPVLTPQVDIHTDSATSTDSTEPLAVAPATSHIARTIPPSASAIAETKRKTSELPTPKPNKRSKVSGTVTSNKVEAGKGQQSLKGFFAPKVKAGADITASSARSNGGASAFETGTSSSDTSGSKTDYANDTVSQGPHQPSTEPPKQHDASCPVSLPSTPDRTTSTNGNRDSATAASPSIASADGSVHDPIVSKESWSKLLRKPAAPLCEHGEPCKSMLTKKKGENQGRSFWMCQHPLGPSGNKERGTQWRCPTFIWCSDFKGDG